MIKGFVPCCHKGSELRHTVDLFRRDQRISEVLLVSDGQEKMLIQLKYVKIAFVPSANDNETNKR